MNGGHRSLGRKRRRSQQVRPSVLVPALVAICLIGAGIGAMLQNTGEAAYPNGHTVIGRVVSSPGPYRVCRAGMFEVITYAVDGIRYNIDDSLRCWDSVGSSVMVSYPPDEPADGRVVVLPSWGLGAVALVLAACAIVIGIGLHARSEHAHRRRWRQLHLYATGGHPLG